MNEFESTQVHTQKMGKIAYTHAHTHYRVNTGIADEHSTSNHQEGGSIWNAPPPRVACPLLWCPAATGCWCVLLLCPERPDQLLVELAVEARETSEGKRLDCRILICSCTRLTHTANTDSLWSSCITRKGCCYGNHHNNRERRPDYTDIGLPRVHLYQDVLWVVSAC